MLQFYTIIVILNIENIKREVLYMAKKKFVCAAFAACLALSACAVSGDNSSASMAAGEAISDSQVQGSDFSEPEPPYISEYGHQTPYTPDFLSEDQKDLFRRADKMYAAFVTSVIEIENEDSFPILENDEFEKLPWVPIEKYGINFYPANGRYHSWEFLDETLHSLFTDDFIQQNFYTSDGWVHIINVNGRTYYATTTRGYIPGYDEDIPWDFSLSYADDDYIRFFISASYSNAEPKTYSMANIVMINTDSGWRFSYFESVY